MANVSVHKFPCKKYSKLIFNQTATGKQTEKHRRAISPKIELDSIGTVLFNQMTVYFIVFK